MKLEEQILGFAAGVSPGSEKDARHAFDEFLALLNQGKVRAASRDANGNWRANSWVKAGILLGFRLGKLADQSGSGPLRFFDKDTYPVKTLVPQDNVRVVPGGSSIRTGAYVAAGVVCMPPMYINVGAYVGEGTMVDSHALVGSCAQIGKRVHLSAAAQIGGVLEPAGALPVIIEDDVFVGGNCGVYEGALVRERAVLAPGTILTGATAVYDVTQDRWHRKEGDHPLEIPAGAVVVPGTRPATTAKAREIGISVYTPVIVKYRDEKTDAKLVLEDVLR
ncbi:MAG: 2,3,4,5-tetrahydropyridine-2,6-dicarboxylate N-succinyltransferase [Gemmatimonadetes bacterium]|nr:2,3,4,5-tetrahydropyridine-2,6-dicarboxylate N-succinyltransferase [Gemmatimonadota bacterium]